jgi:predicted enzyme related to lactoylglutathione lyase
LPRNIQKQKGMEDSGTKTANSASPADTTPKVTGIGGIFFFLDDPKGTKEWYAKHLGLQLNDWGSVSFESRALDRPDEIESTQWCPFKRGDEYFAPSKKDFMVNYRVQNIEALVTNLKAAGVQVLGDIATYDCGKFAHIMDVEGNKIELWEPA